MAETPTDSISKRSRFIAGAIFFLAWLVFDFLCGGVLIVIAPAWSSFVYDFIRLLFIAGLIGSPLIGYWFGPSWWHNFHAWLEVSLFVNVMIPGAGAAIFTGLCGVWVPALFIDYLANANRPAGSGPAGAGATLLAMFFLTPAIILVGPVIGAVGGLVMARRANRFGPKTQSINSRYGLIGGGIAGFVVGILPYILLWLYSIATGTQF